MRDNRVAEEFSSLINPGRPIPYSATCINGITDSMVRNAPVLRSALGNFLDFVGEDILVGHNIHTFDTNFLYDGALRELGRTVQNDYVDTLYLAKVCLPMLPRHRLTDVAAYFQIDTAGAHRALSDCAMNQQCYERLGRIWEKRQAEAGGSRSKASDGQQVVCPECGCVLVKRKGRFGEFWGCSGFPMCRYTRKA